MEVRAWTWTATHSLRHQRKQGILGTKWALSLKLGQRRQEAASGKRHYETVDEDEPEIDMEATFAGEVVEKNQ